MTTRRRIHLERHNADRHLSFGYGIHYCMGSRLAELQLRVLWEEILQRFERIEVQEEPERTFSSFVHGYTSLPVTVTRCRGRRPAARGRAVPGSTHDPHQFVTTT